MNELFINKSGYVDKTAGKALSRVYRESEAKREESLLDEMKARPRVYVVSKYTEDAQLNSFHFCKYCRYVISQNRMPVSGLLMYAPLTEQDRDYKTLAEQFGLSLLDVCDEVWVFNHNRELTDSMRLEIKEARLKGKRVKYHDIKELGL